MASGKVTKSPELSKSLHHLSGQDRNDRRRRPCRTLRESMMYRGALCSCSKIYAAQDDAWRRPLKLPGHVFVGSTLFDATTKPRELGFALVRLDPVRLLEVVHRRRTDGAGNLPFPVQHREQNHHPVKLITSETAAG